MHGISIFSLFGTTTDVEWVSLLSIKLEDEEVILGTHQTELNELILRSTEYEAGHNLGGMSVHLNLTIYRHHFT